MLPALLALLLAPMAILADTTCPKGYVNSTVNGAMFCYKIYKTLLPRDQAEAQCNQEEATLVTISSPEQNNLITTVAKGLSTVHIGVQCFNGYCKFDYGRVLSTNQTSFFFGGLATPEVGQCVILDTTNDIFNGKWISVPCTTVSAFVCQYDPTTAASYYKGLQQSNSNSIHWLSAPINISSPNYPSNYDNYQNCIYFLHNGPFLIQFDYFYTEGNKDILYIYEGKEYSSMTVTKTISGYWPYYQSIYTSSPAAMLVFVSDSQTTYQGFHGTITQTTSSK